MTLLYAVWDGSWWIYAILFLVPDLSFAAYLAGPRIGAIIYNAAHSYMAPMTLMTSGFALSSPLVLSIAMIWLAHIGIDRALGYGLKYSSGSGFTHLGRLDGLLRPDLTAHPLLVLFAPDADRHTKTLAQ
jgi:hypothetical protein